MTEPTETPEEKDKREFVEKLRSLSFNRGKLRSLMPKGMDPDQPTNRMEVGRIEGEGKAWDAHGKRID